ncbi:hypothetical protein MRX96_005667 [Rhipicephalus microplus]
MTEIGRHEDKTPFCFLILPRRFLRGYPEAVVQLEVNQRRLITPYDLHATLLSLLKLPAFDPRPTNKGLNLFGAVPPERTCADAFIAPEFCACTDIARETTDLKVVTLFSHYAVSYMNALATLHFPGKCVQWTLDSVDEASALGGRVAGKVLLRVQLTVTPTAHFEVYGTLYNESFGEKHVDFVQRTLKSIFEKIKVEEEEAIMADGFLQLPGCTLPLYDLQRSIDGDGSEVSDSNYESMCLARKPTVIKQDKNRLNLLEDRLLDGYNVSAKELLCFYREVVRNTSCLVPDTNPALSPPRRLVFGRPLHEEYIQTKVLINYLGDVLKLNYRSRTFSYVWLSDVTHNHVKGITLLDEPLFTFFKDLSNRGVLDTTVVLLLSDHGARYGSTRRSELGRFEDKTPFCFLALPKRFLGEHPEVAARLETNQRRLITAYDLHATLLSLSSLPSFSANHTHHGLNLFDNIPANRTCAGASIPPQFCACLGAYSEQRESPCDT